MLQLCNFLVQVPLYEINFYYILDILLAKLLLVAVESFHRKVAYLVKKMKPRALETLHSLQNLYSFVVYWASTKEMPQWGSKKSAKQNCNNFRLLPEVYQHGNISQ